MSKSKGKGKKPVEEENPPSPVFTLRFKKLQDDFVNIFDAIEAEIKEINEKEIGKEPALFQKPLRIEGRLYTPKQGTFMVKLEPDGEGKVVYLLFRWFDLYFVAFYVEGVWYYFNDFNTRMLPPQSQLTYNPTDYVGKIKLIFSSRYPSVGGYDIKVGRPAFDRCIIALGKAAELHDNTEGQRALTSGPLSFPMVVISEAIRFDPWRSAVKVQIGEEVDKSVDNEYSDYFLSWQSMSTGIAGKTPTQILTKTLEVHDMVNLVRILKRNDAIKAIKAKWREPSSSS